MNWKNWPYWLRGGIICGGVVLFLNIIIYVRFITFGNMGDMGESIVWILLSLPNLIFWFPLIFSGFTKTVFGGLSNETSILIMYSSGVLIWFVLGAIIGLIVGKIKQRK